MSIPQFSSALITHPLPSDVLEKSIGLLSKQDMSSAIKVNREWRRVTVQGAVWVSKAAILRLECVLRQITGRSADVWTERGFQMPETDCRNLQEVQQRVDEIKYKMMPIVCALEPRQLESLNITTFWGFENATQLIRQRQILLEQIAISKIWSTSPFSSAALWLRNDRVVAMLAVLRDGFSLIAASNELKGNKDVVIVAVATCGLALGHASVELRGDRDVVMAAVRWDGLAIKYASEELRGDKGIALLAVSGDLGALQYISAELRCDRDVVMAAARRSLEFADVEMRDDREIVMAAIRRNAWAAIRLASKRLQGDREIVMMAIQQNARIKDDKDIAMAVVSQNGLALCYFSEQLQDDEELVREALQQDVEALQYASPRLQQQFGRDHPQPLLRQ